MIRPHKPSLHEIAQPAVMHVTDNISPQYLSTPQVAKLTGFSVRALETMRAKHVGPIYIKVGNNKNSAIRYHLQDIQEWMLKHREASHA